MAKKSAVKITKADRRRIRQPGGFVASNEDIKRIKQLKKKQPKQNYKQLSKAYFEKKYKKKPAAKPAARLHYTDGTFISNKEKAEVKQAAKYLNIPLSQAIALQSEKKLLRNEIGSVPLHSLRGTIDAYGERNENLKIKIKLPGENRFHIFTSVERAKVALSKMQADIYDLIRATYGIKKGDLIPSDLIPIAPLVFRGKPGSLTPEAINIDLSKWQALAELNEEESEGLFERMQAGEFSYDKKREVTNKLNKKISKKKPKKK